MANITIGIGVALIVLGIIGFLPNHAPTALIPTYIGIALAILGAVALNPSARKHAMHAAVMIGLLGFLGSAGRLIAALIGGTLPSGLAILSTAGTALLTLIFVVLCIRSFITARRNREAQQFPANPPS